MVPSVSLYSFILKQENRELVYIYISYIIMPNGVTLIDGRGHLMGRLASVVAKQLLEGKHIVVVRSEEMNISGSRKSFLSLSLSRVCVGGQYLLFRSLGLSNDKARRYTWW